MRTTYVVIRSTGDGQWGVDVLYHGRRGESHSAICRAVQGLPGALVMSLTTTHLAKEYRAAIDAYRRHGGPIGDPLPVIRNAGRWFEQQRHVTERIRRQMVEEGFLPQGAADLCYLAPLGTVVGGGRHTRPGCPYVGLLAECPADCPRGPNIEMECRKRSWATSRRRSRALLVRWPTTRP